MLRQKDELEKKISSTKQSIMGLMALRDAATEDHPEPPDATLDLAAQLPNWKDLSANMLGLPSPTAKLTELCRSALKASARPLTAPEVRREVELMGFDFSGYDSNPLSSIHTILRRMAGVQATKLEGRTVYVWQDGPIPPPRYQPSWTLSQASGKSLPPPPNTAPTEQTALPPQIRPETLKQFENNPLKGKKIK